MQHKGKKAGSLGEVLEEFAKADDKIGDLDSSTKKLLNKSGVSWKGYFE